MRNNNINSTGTEIGNSKQISINIFSWNVNGLKDKDKINKILNFKHNNPVLSRKKSGSQQYAIDDKLYGVYKSLLYSPLNPQSLLIAQSL